MPPATIPTSEPLSLIAGDSWRWDRTVSDYPPSDGWTLHYALRGAGVLDITADANSTSTGYEVTVVATETKALCAGTYEWTAYVTNVGGERYTINRGRIAVQVDLAQAAVGERVSHAARVLAVLEAALEGRLVDGMESFMIGGRQVQLIPLDDLQRLRNRYAQEVALRKNGGRPVTYGVRFRA